MKNLYFGLFKGLSFTSKVIRFFTRSKYTHVAYLPFYPNTKTILIEVWPENSNNIVSFFKQKWKFNSIYNHSIGTNIEVWKIPVTDKQFSDADYFLRALALNNTGYDWYGVIGFVIPFFKDYKDGYFCSEGVVAALKYANIIDNDIEPWRYSPERLKDLLVLLNGKLEEIIIV